MEPYLRTQCNQLIRTNQKNNNQKVFPSLSKIGLIIGAELDKETKNSTPPKGILMKSTYNISTIKPSYPMIFGYLSRYLTELLPPNFILTKRSLTTTTSNS